jgi:drug/metabolite transporter (DMT)-like permease
LVLGIFALGIVSLLRKSWKVSAKQFWSIFGIGTIGYGVSLGFQFVGTNLSTAANGALVTSATPAFVLFFASILLKERITPRRLVALFVATLGVLAVIDPRMSQFSMPRLWGNLCLIGAALTWSLYSVLVRRITHDVDVLSTSLIAFAGGLPICVPLGIWEALKIGYGTISWEVITGVLFLGFISTALAMYLWNLAFSKLEAGIASLTFFAQPIVGTLLAVFLLGEHISVLFLGGGILIGVGLIIASKT